MQIASPGCPIGSRVDSYPCRERPRRGRIPADPGSGALAFIAVAGLSWGVQISVEVIDQPVAPFLAESAHGDAKGFGIVIGDQLLNLAVGTLPNRNGARQCLLAFAGELQNTAASICRVR